MPMYQIPETAITGHNDGTTLNIHILEDHGDTALIRVDDCGITIRQGAIHTVPVDQIRHINGATYRTYNPATAGPEPHDLTAWLTKHGDPTTWTAVDFDVWEHLHDDTRLAA